MLYQTGVQCSAVSVANLGVLCNQTQGFEENYVPCGETGTFVTCHADGIVTLVCNPTVSPNPPVQQCQ
jgi:hypothetical protein